MKYALLILEKKGGHSPKEYMENIRSTKGVLDAYIIFGRFEFDAVAFIESKTKKGLKEKIIEIANMKGMNSVETLINID